MNANGTGLTITETDAAGSTTFTMSPDLFFDSYLSTLQVNARDVDEIDERGHGFYYGSWLDERRGLVTVMSRDLSLVS
jgi:hypothetical protein